MDYHEDQEEDMEEVPVPISQRQPSFDTGGPKIAQSSEAETKENNTITPVRYRECLKNHAVGIGGHAIDGCGEFMPSGEEGTLDALKCAACNCHRNFHRKEVEGQLMYQFSPFYRAPPPTGYLHLTPSAAPHQHHRPLALPAASGGGGGCSREDEDMSNPSSGGGGGGSGSEGKKRFRTRFTQEQKDRMLEFSERLGWRIQKHDEAAVEQFCSETGVQRHVLKVWMHNNKHTLGKKP